MAPNTMFGRSSQGSRANVNKQPLSDIKENLISRRLASNRRQSMCISVYWQTP